MMAAVNNWSFTKRLFFRFVAAYFVIYILPFPFGYLSFTTRLYNSYYAALNALIAWSGKYILRISFPLVPTSSGSGDTTYNYVRLLLYIVLALVATIVWGVADGRRKSDDRIFYWLTIYLRYWLAFNMIKYGFDKIIKVQFPFPFYSLDKTYGESSPMGLLWTFMGYSTVYNVFTGLTEVIAGGLLFFRKTTLPGALLSVAILSNVVALNFCFDVPVKLHASNLLLMAFFITAPHIKRLTDFFFRNKTVPAVQLQVPFREPRPEPLWFVIKFALIANLIYSTVAQSWRRYPNSGDGAFAKTPLSGIYHVKTFVRNGDTLLPLLTDTSQWKSVNIIFPKQATIKMMNDSTKAYRFETDTTHKIIKLYSSDDSTHKAILSYTTPDSAHLIITGILKKDSVYILMQKQDINKLELLNRGFHWINESPYKK